MKTAWLPDMPINVATLLLDPRVAPLSDAKIGRLFRVLSRAWIVGELHEVPAHIEPVASSLWAEYAELRTKLHEKHRALSEAGQRGGRPPKERVATKPRESLALSHPESTHPYPHPEVITSAPGRRGSRLPDDVELTQEWRAIAAKHGTADVERVFREFVNYWTSLPGAKATKLDWAKTWENRCIEVASWRRAAPREPDSRRNSTARAPDEARQNIPSADETRARFAAEDEERRRAELREQARRVAS